MALEGSALSSAPLLLTLAEGGPPGWIIAAASIAINYAWTEYAVPFRYETLGLNGQRNFYPYEP